MNEYDIKLQALQKEFIEIKKKANWKFEPHQEAIFDFVIQGKKSTTFTIKDYIITLKKGNEYYGFKHFILRHYGEGSTGEIKALDILKLGNVIKQDIQLPTNKPNRKKFIQIKNEKKYTVILKENKPNDLVFTFFSNEDG